MDEASRTALAIDPRLDQVDRFAEALTARDLRLTYVLDTHTHADHLSGMRRLARRTGATVLAHAASKLQGPARRIKGGATFELGAKTVTSSTLRATRPTLSPCSWRATSSPGTPCSRAAPAGPTSWEAAPPISSTPCRGFERLPDTTVVHPGHDYVGRAVTTIGEEKASNPLVREPDRAAFVARLSAKSAPPVNMAAILRHNLGEADAPTITPGELDALRGAGSAPLLLDVRSPIEFEAERIEGSLNVPLEALDARLDEIPEGADLVVVCRTGVRATIAAESLARSGRRARVLDGGMLAWRRARLPLREGRRRLPVDRQVQLIAGSMVLIGVGLGLTVSARGSWRSPPSSGRG